jgi:hypothetical protein
VAAREAATASLHLLTTGDAGPSVLLDMLAARLGDGGGGEDMQRTHQLLCTCSRLNRMLCSRMRLNTAPARLKPTRV